MVFARANPDQSSYDAASLWASLRVEGEWQAPSELAELDIPGWLEGNPSISSDGLEIYYGGNGPKRGVWQSLDAPFQIEEVPFSGYGMQVSRDGHTLYYYSPPSLRSRQRETIAGDWGEERIEVADMDGRYAYRFAVSPDELILVAVNKDLPTIAYHREAAGDPWLGPVTLDGLENFTNCAFGEGALYCGHGPEDDLYRLSFTCR